MKIIIILSVISIFLIGLWLWFSRSNEPLKTGQIKIDDHIINVELANTMQSRERGLSGRDGLVSGHGMLFIFPISGKYGFWMREMKFPLDLVWIKDNRVVGITEKVYPQPDLPIWKLSMHYPPQAINKVLEVVAGSSDLYGWKEGSVVVFPSDEIQ